MNVVRFLSLTILGGWLVACGGTAPAAETAATPPPETAPVEPADRSAAAARELAELEADTRWEAPPESGTPAPELAGETEEPLTRGGSTVGQEFAAGVSALAGRDPCEDALASGDMRAYDECRRDHAAQPCREDYMGDRDPCFDLQGSEREDCVRAARQSFCDCLRANGVHGGGC